MKKIEIHSLRVQYMAFITVLLIILLVLLNTLPLTSSRDRVFEEKKNSLSSQATVVASSLANLDRPSAESIGDVLKLLDISGYSRMVVVDRTAACCMMTAAIPAASRTSRI